MHDFFLFCKVQEAALNPRSVFKAHLTANRLCKHKDFVFTFRSILNFRVRTFWPQNYSFDSFLVQAGHLVFLQGNQRKNYRTNCLNNFSLNHVEKRPTQTAHNVTLLRSSRWSQRLMYPSANTLIHSDSFEIKLLEQNILFRLSCVVCSLRRVPESRCKTSHEDLPSKQTLQLYLPTNEYLRPLGFKKRHSQVSEKSSNTEYTHWQLFG